MPPTPITPPQQGEPGKSEETPTITKEKNVYLSISLRSRMAALGIDPKKHARWGYRVIAGRAHNMERQLAGGEAPMIQLAGMPEAIGAALDELAEKRGLDSVSELAEAIFRAAQTAEGIAIGAPG